MRLWIVEGGWWSTLVRAPDQAVAIEASRKDGPASHQLGWEDYGLEPEQVEAREVPLEGAVGIVESWTG